MRRLLLRISLSLLILSIFMPVVVQNGFSENTASLYPDHGSRNTRIYLQVRGIAGDLYLYWDDLLLGVHAANVQDAQGGGYDIYFYPSDVFNLSNETNYNYTSLGNHNVTVQVFYKYWGGLDVGDIFVTWNATLNFEITEYIPCPDYLDLNASYHSLLENYTELLKNYTDLLKNHTDLQDQFNILLNNYNTLQDNYIILFNSLSNLTNVFNMLNSSFQETYSQLQTNYANLQAIYDVLKYDYDQLHYNNDALVRETTTARNIGLFFAVTTMLFIATTIYFAARKPKQPKT